MLKTSKVAVFATMIFMAASISLAVYAVSNQGTWPSTWPTELEPLRNQSRTLTHSNGGYVHEIPFTNREQFEATWPHILKIKSIEAPIILLSSPDSFRNMGNSIKASVRILSPLTGILVTPQGARYRPGAEAAIPRGEFLKIGPPWPDEIKSKSGALPEYVTYKDGKWVPHTEQTQEDRFMRRARIDIQLIVDGDIVDLNRIPLPPDTPIIDRRFKAEHVNMDAGD